MPPALTPSAVRLQLVSPARALPDRPGWTYEPKLDGCRVVLGVAGQRFVAAAERRRAGVFISEMVIFEFSSDGDLIGVLIGCSHSGTSAGNSATP